MFRSLGWGNSLIIHTLGVHSHSESERLSIAGLPTLLLNSLESYHHKAGSVSGDAAFCGLSVALLSRKKLLPLTKRGQTDNMYIGIVSETFLTSYPYDRVNTLRSK